MPRSQAPLLDDHRELDLILDAMDTKFGAIYNHYDDMRTDFKEIRTDFKELESKVGSRMDRVDERFGDMMRDVDELRGVVRGARARIRNQD